MKKKSTSKKILLMMVLLLAVTAVKAQVNALSDLNAGTLAVYCRGDQVKLTAASTGATSYVWKRYDGPTATGTATTITGQTTANMVDSPTGPGYYTYVSTGYNADGCESVVSDPAVVYTLPGITAAIVSSSPTTTQYCANALPAGLTLTATGGKAQTVSETFGYTYQWYKNGTAITGATSSTYTLNSTDDVAVGSAIAYTARINYVIKTCSEATSNAINFNVLAVPGKPTVTVTP